MKDNRLLIGLVSGTVIGATFGILFAQRKGKKTRKQLAKKIDGFTDVVSKESNHILEEFKEMLTKVQQPA